MTTACASGSPEARPHGSRPKPVERERELAVLGELARRTAAGAPALVILEGPDGIGKTTLLCVLAAQARSLDLRVVRTRAGREGHRLPLSTALALLAELYDGGPAGLPVAPRPGMPSGWDIETGSPSPSWYDLDTGNPSFSVLAELHGCVRSAAARGPLLIVVDDADDADHASLRFLAHTARRLAGLPVFLVLARRGGTDVPALDEVAASPLCQVLRLRPLTRDGVGLLTRQLIGVETGPAFQDACLAATNGNPLTVTQFLMELRNEELPLTADYFTPVGEQDLPAVRLRVTRLLHRQPEATVQGARALAVLGDGASLETCARLAHLDNSVFDRSLLVLISLGLITAADTTNWCFAHALIRNAVLADMSDEERAAAHGRAARLLHDGGESAADVAEHLRRAPTAAADSWARVVLREAAREAMLHLSPERAVELLRACVPEGTESDCDPGLLTELGLAETWVDPEASIRHLTSALESAPYSDLRPRTLGALTGTLTRQGQVARALELLAQYRSDAAASLSACSAPHLLEAQVLLAATANRASIAELLGTASFDLSLSGETPDERALLAARSLISVTRANRVADSLAAARTVCRRGTPATDAPGHLACAATVLLYADRPHEAELVCRQLIEATDAPLDRTCPDLLALSAEAHLRLGSLDAALRTTAGTLGNSAVERGSPQRALSLSVRLHTLVDVGDPAEFASLEAELHDPLRDSWQWNELLCARGRLHLVRQEPKQALEDLLECGRRQTAWQRTNPAVSSWWYWAGHAHLALGDSRAALALAEEAVATARSADLPCVLGAGLGLWAAAVSEDERPPLLEEAEQVLAGTRAALLRARVRVARGVALHRLGYRQAARQVARQGWEESYAIGARSLHADAHRALLATGARPRQPVSRGLDALTQSESQVARLAADGRSNAWIAEKLFVTQRTVEAHLTSAYRKLGLSGRRELRTALEMSEMDGAAAHER
ncbi:AAA family ATPase [Streptomyces europaeiscabiei]|uniref:AAA family ATPase n=1 Tax=Streptomyces europaeiscabiei TaxID=146819 RepID=UPI0029A7E422|nr:AAA family ATPase [Streptomyces europaeiscabiei]MDX2531405.1 AAA family ATPase [Streptomyces europaeiscabiei]